MSTKAHKNLRKIVIKNFNQNNTIKQLAMNKKFPKISFSNEMLTQSNLNNTKSIKLRNHTDQNLMINETNSLLKNNIKKDSITSISYINKTPKKEKKEKKYILKSEINKPGRKQINKTPKIFSKKISLSDIYKLPAILRKDYNTLKLKLSGKKSMTEQFSNKVSISQEKTLNHNINSISNERINEINESRLRMYNGLKGVNL